MQNQNPWAKFSGGEGGGGAFYIFSSYVSFMEEKISNFTIAKA